MTIRTVSVFGEDFIEDLNANFAALDSAANTSAAFYGARGDGETDDWAVLQEGIDAVYDAGGGVFLIPNTVPSFYNISQALRIKTGVHIVAHGATIRNTGGAAGNYSNYPTGGILLCGAWTTDKVEDGTTYALNAITADYPTVTCTTAAQASNFAVGDVILLGSGTVWEIGLGEIPTYGQLNVVTARDVSTGIISLRHPVDNTLSSATIMNLSNSGLNWDHAPGGDSGEAQWAVRDFGVYGGRWIVDNTDMPFLIGGAIDGVIDVEYINAYNGAYYGNLGANIKFSVQDGIGKGAGVELSCLSHNNTVTAGSLTVSGPTNRNAVWHNEGARGNRVEVNRFNGGVSTFTTIVRHQNTFQNSTRIQSAYANTVANAITFEDQVASTGTAPAMTNNSVQIGTGVFTTVSGNHIYSSNNGNASGNTVHGTKIFNTPGSGVAVYFDSSVAGDVVVDSYFSGGTLSHGATSPVGVTVANTYVGGGLSSSTDAFLAGMNILGLTTAALPSKALFTIGVTKATSLALAGASTLLTLTDTFASSVLKQTSAGPAWRYTLLNDGKVYFQRSANGTFWDAVNIALLEIDGSLTWSQRIVGSSGLTITGTTILNLPTSAGATGTLWADSGTVKVSP